MAISNISSKQKTIKDMYIVLDSDNYTVDSTLLYCKYSKHDDIISFGCILDDYRDYFEQFLVDIDVQEKFYYQPAAFAENYYGSPDLDWLILYFAKMLSIFDFKKPTIKILPKSRLLEINKLLVEKKPKVQESYNNPEQYIKEIM